MRKNDDKTFIGELLEHYEIGISIYNDLEECNPDIAYLAHISIMRGVYINWVLVIMFIYKVS